jgi:arginase
MRQTIAVVGAPTSAGAHFSGLEKGPEHFRRAGLFAELLAADLRALDLGDLPMARYQPDRANPSFRSLSRVAEVARQVADRVTIAGREGAWPLVIGGDCTITVGVVAGLRRGEERVGLLYFDGHIDINTPQTSQYGILDSMGLGHLLGLHDNALSRVGSRFPSLAPEDVVVFGYDPAWINPGEQELMEQFGLRGWTYPGIGEADAVAARRALEARVDRYVVHFDVDVLDYLDTPVGNFPKYAGLTLDDAAVCLRRFAESPKFGGIVVTEFNPERDPDGEHARRVIRAVVDALRQGGRQRA